jgi:hypothetical protein
VCCNGRADGDGLNTVIALVTALQKLERKRGRNLQGRKLEELLNAPFDWPVVTPDDHVLRLVHDVVAGISSLEVRDADTSAGDIICHVRRSEVLTSGLLRDVLIVSISPTTYSLADFLGRPVSTYGGAVQTSRVGWSALLDDIAILSVCPGLGLEVGLHSSMTDTDRTRVDPKFDGQSYHASSCLVAYGTNQGNGGRYGKKGDVCPECFKVQQRDARRTRTTSNRSPTDTPSPTINRKHMSPSVKTTSDVWTCHSRLKKQSDDNLHARDGPELHCSPEGSRESRRFDKEA